MRRPPVSALAIVASLMLVASACGGSGPAATPTPTREPLTEAQVLERSGEIMANLGSFRFEMTHEVGTTAFLPGLDVERTQGDVETPDKLYSEFSGLFGEFPISAKLISLDGATYMTNPLTGNWEEIDTTVSPIGFFDPQAGVSSMMDDITDAAYVESASDIYRVAGRMPAESLEPLLGIAVEGNVIDVEVKIDFDSLHLLEARFIGQVMPSDTLDTIRVVRLSRFDEPLNIQAPDIP